MNLLLMILISVIVAFVLAYLIVKFLPLKLRWLVSILLLAASVFLVYLIHNGIMRPIEFNKDKIVRYTKVIKKLKIIRDAEIKYNEVYGDYTNNKNTLINFIENGKLALTQTSNIEEKVHTGGDIYKTISVKKIDTIGYEPVIKYFKNIDYKNMFKVPGTDKEFSIETSKIEKVAGLLVPVFIAKIDKSSVLKGLNSMLIEQENKKIESDQIKGEFVSVGSLNKITTSGNWPPFYDNKKNNVNSKK